MKMPTMFGYSPVCSAGVYVVCVDWTKTDGGISEQLTTTLVLALTACLRYGSDCKASKKSCGTAHCQTSVP